MGKKDEIRQALAAHAAKYGPDSTMLATVVSVDDTALTCVLKDDEDEDALEYEDVRLRPVIDGLESITLFPKVGTWALAVRIESSEDWMLIAAGEIDKFRIVRGELTFEMSDLFLFKKENETLKLILKDLIDAIKLITVPTNSGPSGTPINAASFTDIETRINNFLA